MMWRITLVANVLLMVLFLLASQIAIAPAYNHFVQYPANGGDMVLPAITQTIFSVRKLAIALPCLWTLIPFFVYRSFKHKSTADRNEFLMAFTAITLLVGFSLLVYFGLAGILPYLKIGGIIQ